MNRKIIFILYVISFTIQNACVLDPGQDNNRLPSGYILQVNLLCDSAKSPLPKDILARIQKLAPQVLPKKKTIGERLQWLMDQAGFNQAQCAKFLGVPPNVVSVWVNNLRDPKIKNLKTIAESFGISVELLKGNTVIYGHRPGISKEVLAKIQRLAPKELPKRKSIGERLRWLMEQAKLNKIQFAALLKVQSSTLIRLVNNQNNLGKKTLNNIIELFSIAEELIKGDLKIAGASAVISEKAFEKIQSLAPRVLPKKKTIGERIQWLMDQAGLNQVQCAELLNVRSNVVYVWLKNKRNPRKENLQEVADLFRITFELLKGNTKIQKDHSGISQQTLKNIQKLAPKKLPEKNNIGERLQWLMDQAGLSRVHFAELLDIDYRVLLDWLKDNHNPNANNLKKLAKFFGIPVELLENSAASAFLPVKTFTNLSVQV